MDPKLIALLEAAGWVVACYSPLELEAQDGSTATGRAAMLVIEQVTQAARQG